MSFARISGIGSYLPEKIVTNADLEKMIDTSDQWIRDRTGIVKRHVVREGETTSDLAEHAARRAMEAANICSEDIDLIVVATTTSDLVFPSTACLLQQRLGIHGCPAFDVQAVCAGFVYAMGVVDNFIRAGSAKCALVVGAETVSRIIDWTDRTTGILFGDGAGAVILEASDQPGILSSQLRADGAFVESLWVPSGISKGYDVVQEGRAYMEMRGNEVFKLAVNKLSQLAEETLEANQLEKSDIDWFIPHQANIRIIVAIAKKLRLPMERVIVTVDEHANTSAASVPLALDVAVRDGRIKRGQTLLMEGVGGGFTWGAILLKY